MTWLNLAQFFFGMFLAYYCMSHRLRRFINNGIKSLFRVKAKSHAIPVSSRMKWVDVTFEGAETKIKKAVLNTEPINLGVDKAKIVVEEGEVERWLDKNPDLRKVNL